MSFYSTMNFPESLTKKNMFFDTFASTGRRPHVAPFGVDTRTVTTSKVAHGGRVSASLPEAKIVGTRRSLSKDGIFVLWCGEC